MTNVRAHREKRLGALAATFDFLADLGPELRVVMVDVSSSACEPVDGAPPAPQPTPSGALGEPAIGEPATGVRTLAERGPSDLRRSEEWLNVNRLDAALERELATETLRLNLRYQEEVIEAFNLCPWAKAARTSDNAIPLVDDGRALLEQIADAAKCGAEVMFLVLPKYLGSRLGFDELVAQLIADDARRHHQTSPHFAMAAFHPEAVRQPAKELTPETLVPYLRRSPDPTIQLVRLEALARVRKGEPAGTSFLDPSQIDFAALLATALTPKPSLRQRVANTNHCLFASEAGAQLRRTIDDILDDRRVTHQRLGLPLSPWEHHSR